jgi:hypothetical protein
MTDIPATIMSHHQNTVLGGNIMFVNKIPEKSRHLKFCTGKNLKNQTNKTILAAIKQFKSVYAKRGFRILLLLMDGQFESLRANLADIQINLNTVSNDEHVPEV